MNTSAQRIPASCYDEINPDVVSTLVLVPPFDSQTQRQNKLGIKYYQVSAGTLSERISLDIFPDAQIYYCSPSTAPNFAIPSWPDAVIATSAHWPNTPYVTPAHLSDAAIFDWKQISGRVLEEAIPSINLEPQGNVSQRNLSFNGAFQRAKGDDFEDGWESDFSKELTALVRLYGADSEDDISRLLANPSSMDVAAETMRWLGSSDNRLPLEAKARLLEFGLNSSSVLVRDSAALGFGALDDTIAIRYLRPAVLRESNTELRLDMEQILQEIESALNGSTSVHG